jgi:hypothetical protein
MVELVAEVEQSTPLDLAQSTLIYLKEEHLHDMYNRHDEEEHWEPIQMKSYAPRICSIYNL